MADLVIDDEILRRLEKIAEREQRPVNDVLRTMVEKYPEVPGSPESEAIQAMLDAFDKKAAETSPLEAFLGFFDDVDATDLSVKASGHMSEYFTKKHDDSD